MYFRILIYIVLMGCGVLLGRSGKLSKKLLERLDFIQLICLLFLLFAMGFSMGTDQRVMSSFSSLGLRSLFFSIFTIGFSILAVFLFNVFWSRRGKSETAESGEGMERGGKR